ncbi:hypothetical protein N3K66_005236 [Trichothecium roseum]|uniref:Uncharacterized protein n=1 Tax=Trichothecium roseum TaxID=47278 RepID=A0ACC0V3K1_9HYPO|nr:hypothetical protein N3K66_005236 [Trichothecium roseum]
MYVADIHIVEGNYGLVIAGFAFTISAVVAVILRLVTRGFLVSNIGIDDGFILVAALGTVGFLVAIFEQIRYGLGSYVDYSVLPNFLQSLLATVVAYSITHLSFKFSILFQCKRIFTERRAQRLFLGLIIWLSVYGAFCLVSSLITCWPIAKYWDDTIPGGCIDRSMLHYAFAAINIMNDIMLLLVPLPFLRQLQIPRRSKFVLMAVFACGGFACVVAIIRLHALWVNNSAPIDEQPLKGVDIAIWSGLEINIAIICACVPALKPLFVKFFPRLITSFSDSAKRSREGKNRSMSGSIPLKSFDEQYKFRTFVARDCHGRSQGQTEQEFETRPSSSTTFEEEDCEKGEIRSNRSSYMRDTNFIP